LDNTGQAWGQTVMFCGKCIEHSCSTNVSAIVSCSVRGILTFAWCCSEFCFVAGPHEVSTRLPLLSTEHTFPH